MFMTIQEECQAVRVFKKVCSVSLKKNSIEVLYPIECSQGREICMSQGNVCISDGVTQRQNLEEPMHGLLCLCLYTLVMEASPLVWVSA